MECSDIIPPEGCPAGRALYLPPAHTTISLDKIVKRECKVLVVDAMRGKKTSLTFTVCYEISGVILQTYLDNSSSWEWHFFKFSEFWVKISHACGTSFEVNLRSFPPVRWPGREGFKQTLVLKLLVSSSAWRKRTEKQHTAVNNPRCRDVRMSLEEKKRKWLAGEEDWCSEEWRGGKDDRVMLQDEMMKKRSMEPKQFSGL